MPKFSVELRYPPPRKVTKVLAARLRRTQASEIQATELLEDGGLVVSFGCEADDAAHAVTTIYALIRLGLAEAEPVVSAHSTLDVRAVPLGERSRLSPLAGIAEIAEILGVTRQRASKLAKKDTFPQPVQVLAMGPVYSRHEVLHYRDQRQTSK